MSWTIDEWFVVALARTIRPRRDRVPRFRQPVRPGRDARRPAHPRAGHDAGRGGDVRDQPRPAVHPADQQRCQPAAGARRTACGSRSSSTPRSAATWTGCSCPAARSTGTATPTSPRSGRPGTPKVKLGGGGGGCNLSATIGHLTVWTTRHRSGRTLVAGVRLHHRHRAPHPAGHPGRARLHRRRPAVAGHRAGRVRFPRRPGAAGADLPRRERGRGPRGHRLRPAGGRATCARSRHRPPPSWPRSARWTRWACASPSSPPRSWPGRSRPGHGPDCAC